MTVKELKVVLKDLKLLQRGEKNTKKKDLQQKLSIWIAAKNLHRPKCKVKAYYKLQKDPNKRVL